MESQEFNNRKQIITLQRVKQKLRISIQDVYREYYKLSKILQVIDKCRKREVTVFPVIGARALINLFSNLGGRLL